MIVLGDHRRLVLPAPGPVRRPALHLQGDGGAHGVAGRDRRGSRRAGHRAHREGADDHRQLRVHPLVFAPRRIAGDLRGARFDALRRDPRRSGTRCARRSATSRPRLPEGVVGPFFNDEFGDTFGNIYALTGDGLRLRGAEGLRRPHPAGTAARRRRRQGRTDRPAGREDLDRAVEHQAGHARHSAERGAAGAGPAERGDRRPASSRPPATACSCASAARFDSVEDDPRFPDPRRRPHRSAWATSPRSIAASPIRRRRRMRFMGEDAIGLAVAMKDGGDIIALGKTLDARIRAPAEDPAGRHAAAQGLRPAACGRATRSANSCAC